MKKFLYIAATATLALSSCNKDIAINENAEDCKADVFTATIIEEGTRTTLGTGDDAGKVFWESGDVISINGVPYQSQSAGACSTTFNKQGSESAALAGGLYKAYYPANYSEGLPATCSYQAGKFNMPMYAESTSTTLEFKNICAVLAIKVTSADMATVKKIKVTSDQVLCGSFTVSDNIAIPTSSGDAYKTVTLDCGSEGVATTAEGTTFYIAVPAQTYNYFNIYLSADGTSYKEVMATKKAAGLGSIARNKIFSIAYNKNAAQLWDDGPYWATENCGGLTNHWGVGGSGYQGCYDGTVLENGQIPAQYDNATVAWGNQWRMPTYDEYVTLLTVDKTMTSRPDQTVFTASNGNSIVFPTVNNMGNYYTSTVIPGNQYRHIYYVKFDYTNKNITLLNSGRWEESNVRLVRAVLR